MRPSCAMNELFNALAGHLQARRRRARTRPHRVPDRPAAPTHREHVCRGRAREGAGAAGGAEQRLGPQRLHPAGADPAQSRLQRGALHRTRWHGGRLPPARRERAHRGLGQRHRRSAGPAAQHLRRVLSARRSRNGIGAAGSASALRSSTGWAACSIIRSSSTSALAGARASPCWCRWPQCRASLLRRRSPSRRRGIRSAQAASWSS